MFNKIDFDYVELISLNFYKIVFKPCIFDKFFFKIFSNVIRQLLFINTPGCSVTEVNILGTNNEYGYIFGMKEDVMNLILNIKGLVFKLKNGLDKIYLKLFSRNSVVKGSDVICGNSSKVVNPKHIICHLNDNIKIKVLLKVEKGVGYIPYASDKRLRINKKWKNGILIDANFCPILRVSYIFENIENLYYGNLKRLIFFIETNGSLDGKEAFLISINSFLSKFLNLKLNYNKFYDFRSIDNVFYYSLSIFDAGFSLRTIKILIEYKVYKLSDLVKCTTWDLLNFNRVSKKTILEIKNVLKIYNLFLL
ncbi:MAG: hypothetical protein ACSHUF_00605 [Candidatus Nasuia deltocephalinicola]